MRKLICFLALAMVVAVGAGCAKDVPIEQVLHADYGEYPEQYEKIIKDKMLTVLFDPYSAQYHFDSKPIRKVQSVPFKDPIFGYGGYVLINAKNRLGGYTGAKRYNYIIKNGNLIYFNEEY